MTNFMGQMSIAIHHFGQILFFINAILHLFFASAVAKDAGQLQKRNLPTQLVTGSVWAFATLLGGVMIAFIYWIMHHSSFAHK